METFLIVLVIAIACCVIGFPFTYIYWKQADKWADAEARRMAAERKRAVGDNGASTGGDGERG